MPPCTVQSVMSAPAASCEVVHVTAEDLSDTCDSITERYGLPAATLEDLNPGMDMATLCSNIQLPAGLKICVHNITTEEYQYVFLCALLCCARRSYCFAGWPTTCSTSTKQRQPHTGPTSKHQPMKTCDWSFGGACGYVC